MRLSSQKHLRSKRCFFIVVIASIYIFIIWQNKIRITSSSLGLEIMDTLTWWIGLTMLFALPCYFHQAFQEYKEQNFELIILTNNAPYIMLFRYSALFFDIFFYVIATLPIGILCMILGGISAEEICCRYVYFVLFVFLYNNISFYVRGLESKSTLKIIKEYVIFDISVAILVLLCEIWSTLINKRNFEWSNFNDTIIFGGIVFIVSLVFMFLGHLNLKQMINNQGWQAKEKRLPIKNIETNTINLCKEINRKKEIL